MRLVETNALRIIMCLLQRDAVPHVTGIFLIEVSMDAELKLWIEQKQSVQYYPHFDHIVALKDVIDDISNPKYIVKHSFKPLIRFSHNMVKYSRCKGRYSKKRMLHKASHLDSCVYQYYAYLLSKQYETRIQKDGLTNVAIAYRFRTHKSNIYYAKRAIDFIRKHPGCTILVGDFTTFFDKLDHAYLKQLLCDLLGTSSLPEDHYRVFRSITKYAFVTQDEVLDVIKAEGIKTSKKLLMSMKDLRHHKHLIHYNEENYGIPQGLSISAVLSNIYMLDFDRMCNAFVKAFGGLYMRYCDDTIFVFPNTEKSRVAPLFHSISKIVRSIPGLVLSPEKTRAYYYQAGVIENLCARLGSDDKRAFLDYLGFTFDGKHVQIREKTISKYYYRAYRKADTIRRNRENLNSPVRYGQHNLYEHYSLKGAKTSHKRFLSYVERCEHIFGKSEIISKILNTHYGKLKRRLKGHSKKRKGE